LGVGAHTDTNFVTLVLQDGVVGGLQVFSAGQWIDVPCTGKNILVCNLGEQMEILSRGYFLATPHRVLANTNGHQERISVPFFYNPKLSTLIEPLDFSAGHLPWERPGDYETKEHWRQLSNTMLDSVGANTLKRVARSYPEVFRKHHPNFEAMPNGAIVAKDSVASVKK